MKWDIALGFRHTDYMNRSYSCKGRPVNEGAGNSGAINIPGTPVGSDSGSPTPAHGCWLVLLLIKTGLLTTMIK